MMMNFPLRVLSIIAVCGVLAAGVVRAEVVTSLSSPTAQVGMPVQLQYQFINTDTPKDMPRSIMVDGLDIRLSGTSRRVEIVNLQTASAMIYAYTVIPNRPGNFTIPGFAVQAGGRQVRTQPAELQVSGAGGYMPPPAGVPRQVIPQQVIPPSRAPQQRQAPGRSAPPRTGNGEPAPYFGELVMGAKSAYVGEVVPVELRFHFRADIQFDNLQRPTFGGDGFTAASLTEPEQTEQYIDDVPYNVVTFRSAITPVKTGEIEIPVATMEGRMIAPGAPAGIDPFFDQFFQNFPMPGMGRVENVEARTTSRSLQVNPLPKEGRPENFAGAIGQFTMQASASPKSAKAGEPVTLQLSLEGRGNFDAISPPVLIDEDGWRTYAPKEKFAAADAIGYGGTKTFDFSMVAKTDRSATPGAEFSYFDPLKKEYFTLTADPVAVTAAGSGAAASAQNVSTRPSSPQGQSSGTPAAPTGRADDIAPSASVLAGAKRDFAPWLGAGWFLFLQAAMLLALLVSIPLLIWQRRRARKSARTAELESVLRQTRVAWQQAADRADFYHAAAQFVQARLALLDDRPVALVDPVEALERRIPDPVERLGLQSVLARRDELKYGGGGAGPLDRDEKHRVSALLEKFASNHG